MCPQETSKFQLDFPKDYQNRFHIFYDLMEFRVKDVLLVSSKYDNFILEEDGRLSEEIYTVYSDLNLSIPPPRITRVATAAEAIQAVKKHHFDLIITMRRVGDIDLVSFSRKIKEIVFETPIILLLTSYSEIPNLPSRSKLNNIDKVFVFNGDSDIFLAMIKLIEDSKNVFHDTKVGDVRIIIVVEDTIQYYSIFLPILYKELLAQTQKSVEEGINLSHKILKRRGRSKIVLAETYEEAIEYYESFKDNILGLISDIGFPKNGTKDFSAGYDLVEKIREEHKYLPVLLQSSDPSNKEKVKALDSKFVHKNSPDYLRKIRKFFSESMLFGDFIFRDLNNKEMARATSVSKFVKILPIIPAEIIEFHGSRNDFSNWLFARGEHKIARELAPFTVEEFASGDQIKKFLIDTFKKRHQEFQREGISEFNSEIFDTNPGFVRFGNGSLGGKGRGLAFIRSLLYQEDTTNLFPDIDISIPETIVICTDLFDQFLEENDLHEISLSNISDKDLDKLFISKKLPERLLKALKLIIKNWKQPLAVRSSSILEDSQFQPFAGIYKTFMLSNDQSKLKMRVEYLQQAIKLIYASSFSNIAKTYAKSLGQKIEIEKMAIVIQQIVGKKHENRFYPDFSGVGKSYNFYPVSHQKPEDGVCEIAIGLGEHIVRGGKALFFSPKFPKLLPQVSTPDYALKNTQTEFISLALKRNNVNLLDGERATLEENTIQIAKDDGVLNWLASSYDIQNNRIIDSLVNKYPVLVTFPFILKYNKISIPEIISFLVKISEESFGFTSEIEFAVNLDLKTGKHEFKILQIRPLIIANKNSEHDFDFNNNKAIIYSSKALGNGIYTNLSDIVFVKRNTFDSSSTIEIRDEIATINQKLSSENKEYTLIGPGRWGTKERFLGIPVVWSDVHFARVIIEMGLEDFQIDPSQGMHFFVNLISTGRGYFTVPFMSDLDRIDWKYLSTLEIIEDLKYITHVRTSNPYTIKIDGRKGRGQIEIVSEEI
ncbi:MAG: hypothetical protein HeimC2_11830 [Candidatus Heimdallarchaeota archaeon LC_2]|nr:MAG: hypothetical protein HeimC2_11830 [Candidatus Heimdallarchaeota archaeon LC_2]